MRLDVSIVGAGADVPPAGTPLRVTLEDVSLADVAGVVLGSTDVVAVGGSPAARAELEIDDDVVRGRARLTVRVLGGDGSWRTTQHLPVPPGGGPVEAPLRRV